MPTYDLVIEAEGSIAETISDFIAAVAEAVGLIPGYKHISTKVQQYEDTAIITTRYEKDEPEDSISPMVHPVIVAAVLAVLAIFGLLVLSYYITEVAPTTLGGNVMLFAIGAVAAAYLISQIR
jgi:membrane-bound ClpP family serine protease